MNTLRGGQRSNCIPSYIDLMNTLRGGQRPNCIPPCIDLMNPLRGGQRSYTFFYRLNEHTEGWGET